MEPAAPALPVEQWQDRFTELRDRVAAPPLPLPAISSEQEVTLVRHGQSTWNAESRVQGSSDESVLTDKGVRQAQQTRDLVRVRVDYSPQQQARGVSDASAQPEPHMAQPSRCSGRACMR